jgi:endonuclease-3 related protein
MIVGAILTQRAAWRNAKASIDALRAANLLSVRGIDAGSPEQIAKLIRPSVFHNAKAAKLKAFAGHLSESWDGDLSRFLAQPADRLRRELLDIHGVGPETADAILLYAAGGETFIADGYAFRLFERLGWWEGPRRYEALRQGVLSEVAAGADTYGEFHALIVRHGKEHCLPQPECSDCPIRSDCRWPTLERRG